MTRTIKARYHQGTIVPLEPLDLEEGAELDVTLTRPELSPSPQDPPYRPPEHGKTCLIVKPSKRRCTRIGSSGPAPRCIFESDAPVGHGLDRSSLPRGESLH